MSYTTADLVAAMFPTFKRPPAWAAGVSYYAGSTVRDSNGNVQQAPATGGPFTSGAAAPAWNATLGGATVDGPAGSTFNWTNRGGLPVAQSVSDVQIDQYIAGVDGDIDAILERRFSEAYTTPPFSTFQQWQGTFSADALALLERISRLGAARQLGATLAALGTQIAGTLATNYETEYRELLNELEARDKDGKPRPNGGRYDVLFDPLAGHASARPSLGGNSGGSNPPGSPWREGLESTYFGKLDRRET